MSIKKEVVKKYVQYGFTYIIKSDGSQHPQYMICCAKLSNCYLAPAKLKEQFRKVHGERKYWNTTLAKFKIKRARFGENATLPVFGFVLIDKPILTASYEVAYCKTGIDEKLVKHLC